MSGTGIGVDATIAAGEDGAVTTVRKVTVSRDAVAAARRASLKRAGVTVHVSDEMLRRADQQAQKIREGRRRTA